MRISWGLYKTCRGPGVGGMQEIPMYTIHQGISVSSKCVVTQMPPKKSAKAAAKALAGDGPSSEKPLPPTIADVNVKHYIHMADDIAIIEACPVLHGLHEAVPSTIAQGGRQALQFSCRSTRGLFFRKRDLANHIKTQTVARVALSLLLQFLSYAKCPKCSENTPSNFIQTHGGC